MSPHISTPLLASSIDMFTCVASGSLEHAESIAKNMTVFERVCFANSALLEKDHFERYTDNRRSDLEYTNHLKRLANAIVEFKMIAHYFATFNDHNETLRELKKPRCEEARSANPAPESAKADCPPA